MAEHNYEIIIRTEGSGGGGGSGGSSPSSPASAQEEKGLTESIATVAKRVQGVWAATELGRSALSAGLSLVGVKQGNRDVQDRIGFGLSVAERSFGFLLGFAINPVVGLTSLAATAIDFGRQYAQFSEDRKWNEYQRQYNLQRAGVNWNRSRLEGL